MSYTGITNAIIGITDNGLNTAAEMRTLLTEMSLEYLPYSAGTKNVTLDKLYFSNVDVSLLNNATNKVVINKEYADANYLSSDLGAVVYQGTWNATTNTPTIPVASSGNTGYYYVVNISGTTNVDSVTDWQIGDWIISNGTTWEKADNSSPIVSVDGRVGVVTLGDLYVDLTSTQTVEGIKTFTSKIASTIATDGTAIESTFGDGSTFEVWNSNISGANVYMAGYNNGGDNIQFKTGTADNTGSFSIHGNVTGNITTLKNKQLQYKEGANIQNLNFDTVTGTVDLLLPPTTGTLALTSDFDLQAVLDNGAFAEVDDGDASIQLLDGSVNNRYSYINTANATQSSGWESSAIKTYLNSFVNGVGASYIRADSGEVKLEKKILSTNKTTTVLIDSPTNNTTINFPAKAVDGTYTLATTDDIISVTTLSGLTDTNVGLPTDGQALTWNDTSSIWSATTISGSNIYTADGNLPSVRTIGMDNATGELRIEDYLNQQLLRVTEGLVQLDAGSSFIYLDDGSIDQKADYIQLQNTALTNQIYLPPTTGAMSVTAKNGLELSIGAAYPFAQVGQVLMATDQAGTAVWTTLTGTLSGLTDTTITTPSNGQVLTWSGSTWIDANLPIASLTQNGIVTTGTQTFNGNKTFDDSITVGGTITSTQYFISNITTCVLGTQGTGTIYLRPDNWLSGTAQTSFTTSLATIGTAMTVTGDITGTNTITNETDAFTGTTKVSHMITLSQAEYNSISGSTDAGTMYIII